MMGHVAATSFSLQHIWLLVSALLWFLKRLWCCVGWKNEARTWNLNEEEYESKDARFFFLSRARFSFEPLQFVFLTALKLPIISKRVGLVELHCKTTSIVQLK